MNLPTPDSLPEALQYVVWALGLLAGILVLGWRGFRWLISQIRDEFKTAIRSDEFAAVVDRRVASAFQGAMEPLLAGQRDLAKDVGRAQRTADRAHERIDDIEKGVDAA